MNDRKLYEQILGIPQPWYVEEVALRLDQGEIEVRVAGLAAVEQCPECGKRCSRYDGAERRWRHVDTCQYRTILVAAVPRVDCDEHGVRQVRVPWAQERSGFTALFEALVIDWLQATESIATVAKGLRLSWDEVAGIRARAVVRGMKRRGRAPLPASVGVDETSIRRGHEYITVVNALGQARVLEVIDDRTQASLDAFWSQYDASELKVVESVAMDMWAAYITSTRKHPSMADEKIVFDKFHIMKHLGDAVDKVRRQEHRTLRAAGDDRLARTRYLWLTHPERLEGEARYDELGRDLLRDLHVRRLRKHDGARLPRMWRHVSVGHHACAHPPERLLPRLPDRGDRLYQPGCADRVSPERHGEDDPALEQRHAWPLFTQTLADGMSRPASITVSNYCTGLTIDTQPRVSVVSRRWFLGRRARRPDHQHPRHDEVEIAEARMVTNAVVIRGKSHPDTRGRGL
jgi:transposase